MHDLNIAIVFNELEQTHHESAIPAISGDFS